MTESCLCGGSCKHEKISTGEHFCCEDNHASECSIDRIEKLKQAIAEIGFQVEETEEGIRIS